ncbi:general odorant-binding protein 83a-like [Athalia rosae]|uniref:general odorant-binding protein 83a-like n=1 Tax=Athalia rosae TaxID=37344 RepID=UPI002033D900|nr:general odorant-binding protein 83a-like [Athalia rosae]
MSNFVFCVFIVSIFFFDKSLALSDEVQEMVKMLHDSCVEETGVTEALIDGARTGNFAEDNSLKCYMKCLMMQLSALTDDGDIDVETVISMLPDEMKADGEPIIRACGTVKGADECDTVFLTQKCYYQQSPTKYFLI